MHLLASAVLLLVLTGCASGFGKSTPEQKAAFDAKYPDLAPKRK